MNAFLRGLGLFCLAFLVHAIIWRVHLPRKQPRAIFLTFAGTLIVALAIQAGPEAAEWQTLSLSEFVRMSLLFISLMMAYIVTYPAIKADSPSLVIINAIKDAGTRGLDEKRFRELMSDDLLVKPRVMDLLADGMAHMEGDRFVLSPKGVIFARVFKAYRRLLKAGKGG